MSPLRRLKGESRKAPPAALPMRRRAFAGRRPAWLMLTPLTALLLAGCGGQPHEDLRLWMSQERAKLHPHVQPIEAPKPFTPASYSLADQTDPFSPAKLETGVRQEMNKLSPEVLAQMNRPRQPLEQYSLDQIQMVGSLKIKGQDYALLKAANLLYRAHVGEYAGQHYGRITKIDENQVVLQELVQDATGDWVQRTATLQLQESSK
ncbi:putative Tfp pilus assembly protein PilP [Thiomonas sp. X19]|uniref:pilus assembly protein PilP n=1 Tax=Thiomonas sp. X19 TaxID=1050370 RepID=UPI000B73EAA0|nr:pilus assembly protein PilP [Thiomonas sp. X19]SCC91437.1 putative Tfp pilus assembly protein PilP [Thiomonas sp. X19]